MTEPKQPDDHPTPEQAPASQPHAPNGVPPEAGDAEAKGYPSNDRLDTEHVASPDAHDPS